MSATDIRTLSMLIAKTVESADGYEQVAAAEKAGDLAQTFRQFASERRSIAADLRGLVVRLGGTLPDEGTLPAVAHDQFLKLRTAFDNDRRAAIAEVERSAEAIKAGYEAALTAELSAEVRQAIMRAYESICAGHRVASTLKKRWAA